MNKLLLTIILLTMFSYNAFGAGRSPLVTLKRPTCDKIIGTKLYFAFNKEITHTITPLGGYTYHGTGSNLVTEADYLFKINYQIKSCTIKYQVKEETTTSWSDEYSITNFATCEWSQNYGDASVTYCDNDELMAVYSATGTFKVVGYNNNPPNKKATLTAHCKLKYAGEDAKYYQGCSPNTNSIFSCPYTLYVGNPTNEGSWIDRYMAKTFANITEIQRLALTIVQFIKTKK